MDRIFFGTVSALSFALNLCSKAVVGWGADGARKRLFFPVPSDPGPLSGRNSCDRMIDSPG